MVSLILVFAVLLGFQPTDTPTNSLPNQAKEQAAIYLEGIKTHEELNINLWALAELCQNKGQEELINYIKSEANRTKYFRDLNGVLCEEQPKYRLLEKLALSYGHPDFLIAAMLQKSDSTSRETLYSRYRTMHKLSEREGLNYEKLITHIINNSSIDSSTLPVEQFHFVHFLLLFNTEALDNQVITDDYLKKLANHWYQQNLNFNPHSLKSSLYLVTLFRVLYLTNDYSKIHTIYSDLTREKLFPLSNDRLRVFRNLDFAMYQIGRYDLSLEVSRNHSLPLANFLNSQKELLSIMQTQGVYLYQIGKIQQAQDIFQEVLKRATEENIPVNKTSLYHNLSITHFKSGNFDKYLEIQFQALELAQKEQNYEHQFKILQNLHIFYRRNGDISSSLRYINEALKLSKRHGNIEDLGSIFVSLGVFYRDLKSNPDSAATYFQKADSVINRQQNFNLYFKLLTEKARLYETQNKFQQALNIYRSTKQTVRSQKNTQTYLHALVDEARILLKLDKISEVGEVIAILNNSDLSLLDFAQIVKAKTLEANYLITTGEPNSAYEILKPTIRQVVERAQSSTDLQSGFWSIEQEYLDAFKLFVDLLIETDRPGEAALALDQLKTINDAAFYQDPMVKAQQLNESELTQYRQLANNLDQLRKQKLSASSRERVQIQNKIDRLNAQKRALDRKITQYADKPTINMHQVQRQLSSNDLILHITELEETYYLASITKRNIDFHKVDLDEQTRGLFDQSIQALSTGETDLNKLYRLGKKLNISKLASSIENVILIPDSYLFQLPMDILPLTPPSSHYSYGEPTYFIEQYRTEYLTSLNEFVHGAQPDKSFNWDYVGFGISEFNNAGSELMPLPYARREILQISRELTNLEDHRTILEEQSTEEAFRAAAPKARILHLATHSTVSEQDPLFSRIYMSSPAGQTETEQFNSQIFAYELFEMNLTNDLIMLNSCESGSGSYLQGSGIVGISRALRYAGAESLVLNLWSVNDMMASDFATRFYRALNDGDSKSEALRKAKVYFLKQKNANPHYWGPYMLIGSSQAVVKPMQSSNIYVASGFMLYLIVMVSLSYMAQQQNIPTGNKRE